MLVRDEDDILAETIENILKWIDFLYVFDTGSTDSTVEILREYARKDERVKIHFASPVVFNQNIRSALFEIYRGNFKNGDWIVKLDADEIYYVTPPDFVRNKLNNNESCVYLTWYYFRLTDNEVNGYESGRIDIHEDRKRSIIDRRRFYFVPEYSEPRMFLYRNTMSWGENLAFPANAGYIAKERIPVLHYPHRDTLQMQKRFKLRSTVNKTHGYAGRHWNIDDWRLEVVKTELPFSNELDRPALGLASIKGLDVSEIQYWSKDERLPQIKYLNHIKPPFKRLFQWLLYRSVISVIDRFRRKTSEDFVSKFKQSNPIND